ncbi:MAG: nucleotidyltransferase family protein [Campylobacterota bacterium]|nr:nucleotidyltransferase family protein [Campylobacterota bacterium]
MNTKEEILSFLSENKNELLSKFHLSKIGLFGSFSRDEATKDSDIDIIFDFQDNVADIYTLKIELKKYLSQTFNKSVDLAREKYLKPYIKEQILQDAIYV